MGSRKRIGYSVPGSYFTSLNCLLTSDAVRSKDRSSHKGGIMWYTPTFRKHLPGIVTMSGWGIVHPGLHYWSQWPLQQYATAWVGCISLATFAKSIGSAFYWGTVEATKAGAKNFAQDPDVCMADPMGRERPSAFTSRRAGPPSRRLVDQRTLSA